MKKPTIFFSHSSKDKDMIIKLKDKINAFTGGTLDIFVSSDGQSIPFGTNWIHKIEAGLENAELMFVFVTPNSLQSNWIYFESGFAYSKGIEVIPIAISSDIALLKPPLNLLQGFNLDSFDSMNNIISIINKKFSFSFTECFIEKDYSEIVQNNLFEENFNWDDMIKMIKFSIYSSSVNDDGKEIKFDLARIHEKIIQYLDDNDYKYSIGRDYLNNSIKTLLVLGIKISYKPTYIPTTVNSRETPGDITFLISPCNFDKSFQLLKELLSMIKEDENSYLWFSFSPQYNIIEDEEKFSSIISKHLDDFSYIKKQPRSYLYNDLRFGVFNINKSEPIFKKDMILYVSFSIESVSLVDICNLISKLISIGIINEVRL